MVPTSPTSLNAQNIPTDAKSHQHHILAITRNLRRYYNRRLNTISSNLISECHASNNLRNENRVLNNEILSINNQLTNERLYQTHIAIDHIIEEIEKKEKEDKRKIKQKRS